MRINRLIGLMAILLLSAACSGPQPLRIHSEVDSLAAPQTQQKMNFVILPGSKDITEQDLQFLEYKAYVEKALLRRGFNKANSMQDGDVVLFLSYGVGPPEIRQYSYEVPVWADGGYYRRSRFYGGVSGYAQRIESYTTYNRYLVLDAYDMAAYRQQKWVQLWQTRVSSNGNSNDLRLVFPYMVAAMQPYIGTNTGHMVSIDIDELNPLLRDLLPPPIPAPLTVPVK